MRFQVRYFDAAQAAVLDAELDAADEPTLRAQWTRGRLLAVKPLGGGAVSSAKPRHGRLQVDAAQWCQELSTLLTAGMTVVEGVETLQAQARERGAPDALHQALLHHMQQGLSLSKAMQATGAFPDVLVAGVTASERASTLVSALRDYLRYAELLTQLRRQATSAAIYPTIVVLLGAGIGVFLLLYVIPRFSKMYANFHGTMSLTTEWLLVLSRVLQNHLPVVLSTLLAVSAGLAWAWQRGWVADGAAAFVEGIGPLRRQWDHFRLAKLYHSLALMFRGGYTLDEALGVCEQLGLGHRLASGIGQARRSLSQGRAASRSLADGGLTDGVSARLLAVGERTGSFDVILQTIAERHAQAFTLFLDRATRIVEPVLLLGVALVVGGIVVMMYMPIFDMANGVR